ncbi:hypothetical protein [Thermococcus sp. Bubb.Bath]|uniref:DUF7344 domain-containing protein n=1 Tax=Thermococcus sp. Bubb.Bath TaxID=1638242 RepID=UPI00143B04BC|nr:hypothetical protein [Thermococcus sp. Bubb.Bath]NJF26169.1 hypothetical protein [Thermococcus sp. Bubb.Bath]
MLTEKASSSMILGNERRMLLVEFLQKQDGRAELRDIVEYIAEREGDTDRKHRKSVYVSLMQTHIPKLEREGILTFNRGVITLLKVPNGVNLYMEVVGKNDISWSAFYMGTSFLFLVAGFYLASFPLVISSLVYLTMSLFHHAKVRKLL